ncbi:hypothetical protein ACHAXT_012918 [Thalassiosira profunda]
MISRAVAALALCGALVVAAAKSAEEQSTPAWRQLGTNANYRITAILDVNGGAEAGPTFESFADDGSKPAEKLLRDDASTKSTKTPGYSVPIEVLTLQDADGAWRQRISYYSGAQVDYNANGQGYKVVSTPYAPKLDDNSATIGRDTKERTCFFTGGDSSDDKQIPYLNFFPTVEQMEHYTLGKLVTTEPGIPYRVASLEANHGKYDATSETTQPDASYDANTGMPSNDWFQFHYEESLSSSGPAGSGSVARPIQWTMLARNQIINAHTENWVLRYLSYDPIDGEDEKKLWEGWFDAKFKGDCGDSPDQVTLAEDSGGVRRLNRLGMFFSSSSHHAQDDGVAHPTKARPSEFDLFLARHNRLYPRPEEYFKREALHDSNVKKVERWNQEHAGTTQFSQHEFMDMTTEEIMKFRGGHIPLSKGKKVVREGLGPFAKAGLGGLRQSVANREGLLMGGGDGENSSSDDDDDDGDDYTEHKVPKDFDPSTLPESFDWREHLPGSVGPVKDQGFCGSCWAFSFISAVESHWFIANDQSVVLPEQFVNDCVWSEVTHACDGGNSGPAAKEIIGRFAGRVPIREAYGGYLSVDGECYIDILDNIGMIEGNKRNTWPSTPSSQASTIQLTDWVVLPERDDIATKHALYTQGPLAVALNVVEEATYFSSGVLDVESCLKHDAENLDHAINLVGWGVDELPDGSKAEHWILRNSWSDLWGDSGYFKVRMGERDCGVTTSAGYPLVAKKKSELDPEPSVAIVAAS